MAMPRAMLPIRLTGKESGALVEEFLGARYISLAPPSLRTLADGGALAAYTNARQRYVVTAPALCSYVVGEIQGAEAEDSAPWRTAISVLSMLSSEHASWVEVSSERVLNSTCGPNWMLHGHCTDAYKPPFTEVAVNAEQPRPQGDRGRRAYTTLPAERP